MEDPVGVVRYGVGDAVEVHAFGHWYRGEVVKVGRKTVTVRFDTGGTRGREKTVNPGKWERTVGGMVGPLVRKVAAS